MLTRTVFTALLTLSIAVPQLFGGANSNSVAPELTVSTVGNNSIALKLSAPTPQMSTVHKDGMEYQEFANHTGSYAGSPGMANLPAWTKVVEIPYGMMPVLNIKSGDERIISDIDVLPMPSLAEDNPNVPLDFARIASTTDALYPAQIAEVSATYSMAGKSFAVIAVNPYRYNSARRELSFTEDVTVEVKLVPDPDFTPVRETPMTLAKYEMLKGLSNDPDLRRDDFNLQNDFIGHYAVVMPDIDGIVAAMEPFIQWKKQKGYIVTEMIYDDPSKEDIYTDLRSAYQDWEVPPDHVLLVGSAYGGGNTDIMPRWNDATGGQARASWYISDHPYVMWEQNGTFDSDEPEDWLPNAMIGRLPVENDTQAERVVAKILGYETFENNDDDFDDQYVEHAALIACGVASCILSSQVVEEIMMSNGYGVDDIHREYWQWHSGQRVELNDLKDAVNAGVGFVTFRGYNDWGNVTQSEIGSYRNGWMLPIVNGMVCETNDFGHRSAVACRGEAWVLGWYGNKPTGGVASWGPTDLYTHTWFNNTMLAEFYHQLFNNDIRTHGALIDLAKMSLIRNYPSDLVIGNGERVGYYFFTYALLGDPGLQIWTHNPEPMSADISSDLSVGANVIRALIADDNDSPVADAYVHVFLDDDHRWGGYTDADGMVEIATPPLESGSYFFTVTAANFIPIRDEMEVSQTEQFVSLKSVSIDDDNNEGSEGNEDGLVNPGETIELRFDLLNAGSSASGAGTVTVESNNPFAEIAEASVEFASINSGEESILDDPLTIYIEPGTPHGTLIPLRYTIETGDGAWEANSTLQVVGYNLAIRAFTFTEEIEPGAEAELVVSVSNIGSMNSQDLSATLYCNNVLVQIDEPEATFDAINIDEFQRNVTHPFEVKIGNDAYQGMAASFGILIEDENGWRDSLTFSTTLGEPVPTSPQGPDGYGYYAFDESDESSGMAPEFAWIEGTTEVNGLNDPYVAPPASTSFQGSVVDNISLPFDFTYYGETYSEISIGSNGWFCFGKTDIIAWHNQEIGSALGPPAMVAPFWDDLWNGDVYTRFDRNNALFIIEWRDWENAEGGPITFEVILKDPDTYQTKTGDGEIIFQYDEVPGNMGAPRRDYAEEFVSIGISDHLHMNKTQVAHAGDWSPFTANFERAEDGVAILFSTGPIETLGNVTGTVTDATDDSPIENVRVFLKNTGWFAMTDAEGNYMMERVPEGEYNLIARKQGFNDGYSADEQIVTDETTEVDFSLLHPTFELDVEKISEYVDPGDLATVNLPFTNNGNGPLEVKIRVKPPEVPVNEWIKLAEWNISAQLRYIEDGDTNYDTNLKGIAFDGDNVLISGPRKNRVQPNYIYAINRDGEFDHAFEQHTTDSSARFGWESLTMMGDYVAGCDKDSIVVIDTTGALIQTFTMQNTGLTRIPYTVYMPERESFMITTRNSEELYEINANGDVLSSFLIGEYYGGQARTYGMAWHPQDRDGHQLYIFYNNQAYDQQYGTRLVVDKLNLETGEMMNVQAIPFFNPDNPEENDYSAEPYDCHITKLWDPNKWVFIALLNHAGGDRVLVYEIETNNSWLSFEPSQLTLEAGSDGSIDVLLDSDRLPRHHYERELQIMHNAVGGERLMELDFYVGIDAIHGGGQPENLPAEFALFSPAPNPFNPSTRLSFTLPSSSIAGMQIVDLNGRVIQDLQFGTLQAGSHTVTFDGAGYPSGVYFARLSTSHGVATQKMVLMK
ncbi:C25 family cysteine peptidase [Calditrichota bacterium]